LGEPSIKLNNFSKNKILVSNQIRPITEYQFNDKNEKMLSYNFKLIFNFAFKTGFELQKIAAYGF